MYMYISYCEQFLYAIKLIDCKFVKYIFNLKIPFNSTLLNILSPRTHLQIISHLLYPGLKYSRKCDDMGNMCTLLNIKNRKRDNGIFQSSNIRNIQLGTLQLIIIWVMNKCYINKIKLKLILIVC